MGKASSKPDIDGSTVVMLQYCGVFFSNQIDGLIALQDSGLLSLDEIPPEGQLIRVTKDGQKMHFGWFDSFGRISKRPIMQHYFSATDVITLVISPDKNLFIESHFITAIHKTTSHPDLSNVTILVIATKCEENTEDVMGAEEVKKKFEEHCLVFPNQTLHVIEADKLDTEVMEKAFTLAAESRMAKDQLEESQAEKLLKNKSLDQKLKSKIVQHWKSLKIF